LEERDRTVGVSEERLTHVDPEGTARMVDVGDKPTSVRRAVAEAIVRMSEQTMALVRRGDAPKGDVLATARIAGIQAAKRTDELIPLAHPLPLTHIEVDARVEPPAGGVLIRAEVRTVARTGVEMEAMTACAVAALAVYDMVKGVERGVEVERIALVEKTGGSNDWRRGPAAR
jgi:cyclic pyranopterin monophosphate synthase